MCGSGSSHLDGSPQDGELRRVPAGLVSLQNLLDELLDLALGHPISVSRLPEDVDALRQLIIDAGLAERRAHDTRESVCVCVRERERESVRASSSSPAPSSAAGNSVLICVCVCVL